MLCIYLYRVYICVHVCACVSRHVLCSYREVVLDQDVTMQNIFFVDDKRVLQLCARVQLLFDLSAAGSFGMQSLVWRALMCLNRIIQHGGAFLEISSATLLK